MTSDDSKMLAGASTALTMCRALFQALPWIHLSNPHNNAR